MKKRFVSMILACTLCMLMCATPFASAAQVNNDSTYTESETIDVVDTNGNVLGSVKAPRALILPGAAIYVDSIKVMVYEASKWVVLHQQEIGALFDMLTNGFDALQAQLGRLTGAWFNKAQGEYTGVEKPDGNYCQRMPGTDRWACRFSA